MHGQPSCRTLLRGSLVRAAEARELETGSGVRVRRSLLLLLTYIFPFRVVRGVLCWFHLLGLLGEVV